MAPTERSRLLRILHGRCDAIASEWYRAIALTSLTSLSSAEVRQRLIALTQQAVDALTSEPFDQTQAYAIGEALVHLRYIQPEALGKTQEILAHHLVEGLPADQMAALQPRLAALLAGVAAGFFEQARATILSEQEQIRGALVTALRQATEALQRAYEDVERQVEERTVELRATNELLQGEIAERKRAEEALRRSMEETAHGHRSLLALSQAAQAVQRTRTPDAVYRTILDEVVKLGYHATIFTRRAEPSDDISDAVPGEVPTEESTYLVLTHHTFGPALVQATEQIADFSPWNFRIPLLPGGFFERIIAEGNSTFRELSTELLTETLPGPLSSAAGPLATVLGLDQAIYAPLTVEGKGEGLLIVTGVGLTEADVPAVTAFANQTSIALENARLYEETRAWAAELERRVAERTRELSRTNADLEAEIAVRKRTEEALTRHTQRLEIVHEIDQAILAAESPEAIAQVALQRIRQLVPCPRASITVFDFESDEFTILIAYASGEIGLQQGTRVTLEGMRNFIEDLEQGKPIVMEDYLALSEAPSLIEVWSGIERSSISMPLLAQGELVGALNLVSDIPGAFMLEQAEIIREVADSLAVAIQHAQLFAQVHASRERLRRLAQEIVSSQEEGRQRLSRELHDEAGQLLTAVKISLDLVREDLPAEFDSLRKRVSEAAALTDSTMEHIRMLAQDLRPPALDAVGLNPTLEGFCRDFAARMQLPVDYVGLEVPALPDAVSICLYRFVQEALTNVVRHARARHAQVMLRCDANQIHLSVADDGQGFNTQVVMSGPDQPTGLGLLGMQERIEALGGRLEIDARPNHGARLIAHVPWKEDA